MKKITLFISALFIASATFVACEDYLDVQPPFAQGAENYFNTPEEYELALIGAYDLLQASFLNVWIGEIASDNSIAGGESVTDTEGLHQIEAMNHNGVNQELQNIFRWYYAGVTRCNYIMEFKDKIDFDGKNQILAETRFLRGYYYFQLVKYFGDIPLIVDERIGADEVTEIDREDISTVYDQIEADLSFAASNLPWNNPIKGRVEKGAAYALLGKVHLYQNEFAPAAEALDSAIILGEINAGYGLVADYANLWGAADEDNEETVFDVEYSGQQGGGYGCLICLEGNAAVGFHGIRQYEGPVYATGNSYNLPTAKIYNAFDVNDPRRDVSILNIDSFISLQPNPSAISYVKGAGGHTGYYNNKYLKKSDELGLPDDDLTSPVNYKAIRYSDVLLMAAEAHAQNNNEGTALTLVNRVRNRASMPPLSGSGQQLIEAIWEERRLELAGEGHRFFDLVRTGQAAAEIDGFVSGKHEVFPIPQIELDLSGGNWSQNSNY
jgi:tetratricopeptide (TPR) repeat protein